MKYKTPLLLIVGITIFWLFFHLLMVYYVENLSERGIFGDSFGAINSLFSGLAFGGIIYTILLQSKELELQREELSNTRNELKRSADAQEKLEQAQNFQIATMNLTARINALNILIDHYGLIMSKYTNGGNDYWKAHDEQKPYLTELKLILSEIEK